MKTNNKHWDFFPLVHQCLCVSLHWSLVWLHNTWNIECEKSDVSDCFRCLRIRLKVTLTLHMRSCLRKNQSQSYVSVFTLGLFLPSKWTSTYDEGSFSVYVNTPKVLRSLWRKSSKYLLQIDDMLCCDGTLEMLVSSHCQSFERGLSSFSITSVVYFHGTQIFFLSVWGKHLGLKF